MVFIIAILSFCSLVYELQLAQLLASLLGNTVYRYSMIVGIYIAALGFGAFFVKGETNNKIKKLFRVEILLSVLGGGSILYLEAFYLLFPNVYFFAFLCYLTVVIIGLLSGMELPLLLNIKKDKTTLIIGLNYFGAFIGAILFPLLFFSLLGLTKTSLIIGLINVLVALFISFNFQKRYYHIFVCIIILIIFIILLQFSFKIESYFILNFIK